MNRSESETVCQALQQIGVPATIEPNGLAVGYDDRNGDWNLQTLPAEVHEALQEGQRDYRPHMAGCVLGEVDGTGLPVVYVRQGDRWIAVDGEGVWHGRTDGPKTIVSLPCKALDDGGLIEDEGEGLEVTKAICEVVKNNLWRLRPIP